MSAVHAALAAAEQTRLESSRPTGALPALSALQPPSSAQALSVAAKAAKRVKAEALATDLRVRTREPLAPIVQGLSMAQVDVVYLSGWGPGHRDRISAALPFVPSNRRVDWISRDFAEHALASVLGPDTHKIHLSCREKRYGQLLDELRTDVRCLFSCRRRRTFVFVAS